MIRRAHTLCALVGAGLLTATACASSPNGAAQGLPGCYFFEPGETTETFRTATGVRLTDQPLEGWPGIMRRGNVKVAVTLRREGEADYPFGYWLQESADSVEIGYPSGGVVVLKLVREGDALKGTGYAQGDTWSYGEEPAGPTQFPVRLERGDCPQ